jgi:hypothetical protein
VGFEVKIGSLHLRAMSTGKEGLDMEGEEEEWEGLRFCKCCRRLSLFSLTLVGGGNADCGGASSAGDLQDS